MRTDAKISDLMEVLDANGVVKVRGFGVFTRKVRAARVMRNPKTNEPVSVPARPYIHFKPSKAPEVPV